jgi:hypothetical protein
MRKPSHIFLVGALICVGIAGCTHTRDVSSMPEYKPWIGKEVSLTGPGEYHVVAPKWSAYYLEPANVVPDCPILGKVSMERKVIIEAVNETKGTYLIGGPFTRVHLILSTEHPLEKNKRIRVESELNYVEPFRDRVGHTLDWMQAAESVNRSPVPGSR